MIAKDGRMVAAAGNSVVQDLDPNAQTEVNAIRAACHVLGNLDLSGCLLHTSCECCPIFLWIRRSTASRSFRRKQAQASAVWMEFRLLPDGTRY